MGSGVTAVAASSGSHTCALQGGRLLLGAGRLQPARQRDDDDSLHAGLGGGRRDGQQQRDRGRRRLGSHLGPEGHLPVRLGDNTYGQLGDGTTTDHTTPVQVSGWCQIPPGPFSKTAPVSGTTNLPITVTLSWSAPVTGTVHSYRYCYATTTGCTPSTQVPSTTTSITVTGLTPGATYHWQVRACADSGCGVFTDANGSGGHWSFTVASAPGAFGKSAPANGASGQPTNPTLSWNAASGTVNHYRYCYATTTGCTPSTQVPSTTTSVTVTGLTPGATYHWQVRACADSGCTVFTNASGGHWSFTVASAPGAFGKSAPVSGTTNLPITVTLSWNAASGTVNHYRYCYATTTGCTPSTQVPSTTTSVTVTGLTPGETYHWQVRACADSGCTVFTDANGSGGHWSFTVASAPGAFGKSAPVSGTTNLPITVTLSWNAASGTVNHYRYCYATTTGCTPGTSVGTATSVELSGLAAGTTYTGRCAPAPTVTARCSRMRTAAADTGPSRWRARLGRLGRVRR
jgi:hypothetical protein